MTVGLKGREILLKRGNGLSPATFTTILGGKSRSMTINADIVDITTSDDAENAATSLKRALLEHAGTVSFSISLSGAFQDLAVFPLIETDIINCKLTEYQLAFGNGDVFQGLFQLSNLEYAGEANGEQTYSLTLESSGKITPMR